MSAAQVEAGPRTEPEATGRDGGPQPLRLLVAEDSEDLSELLDMVLSRAGFDVVGLALDGEQCVELATRLQPDLLVLDLHMPVLGGLEALPRVLAASPGTKVVVHSAVEAACAMETAHACGAMAYIQKGVTPSTIVAHIRRVADTAPGTTVEPYPLCRDYTEDKLRVAAMPRVLPEPRRSRPDGRD